MCWAGTVLLNDGVTMLGMLWTTENLTDWTATTFPPLEGFDSSAAFDTDEPANGTVRVTGSSFFGEGSDPLIDGGPTMWHADLFTVELDLTGTTDLNDVVTGAPDGAQLTTVLGLEAVPDCNANCLLSTYVFAQPRVSRDTLPHAAVLFAQQQEAIPAVSTWGMVAMALLVLTAGTLVYMRRWPAHGAAA